MYKNFGYSESNNMRLKLKRIIDLKQLESDRIKINRSIHNMLNKKFNNILDIQQVIDLMVKVDGLRSYNLNKYIVDRFNYYSKNLKIMLSLSYLKLIVNEKTYEGIKLSKLNDKLYLYKLIEKGYKGQTTNELPQNGHHYTSFNNVFDAEIIYQNRKNICFAYKLIKICKTDSNFYVIFKDTDVTLLTDLSDILDFEVEKSILKYILGEGLEYENYMGSLYQVINLCTMSKLIPEKVFNKLNYKKYAYNTIEPISDYNCFYTGSDIMQIVYDMYEAFGFEGSIKDYEFTKEDYRDYTGLDEEDIEEYSENNPVYKLEIILPLSKVKNEKKLMDLIGDDFVDTDLETGDNNYYNYNYDIEKDTLYIYYSDEGFFNLQFLKDLSELMALVYEGIANECAA